MVSQPRLAAREGGAESLAQLELIESLFEVLHRSGPSAFLEAMLAHSHPDVEVRAYSAPDRVFRGAEEVRTYLRTTQGEGTQIHARAHQYEDEGDTVLVLGSIRVVRGDGAFAETKVRWLYHFRDGLIDSLTWEPRAGGC